MSKSKGKQRRKTRRGSRRGGLNSSRGFTINTEWAGTVDSGKAIELTFDSFFPAKETIGTATQKIWAGVPWRLLSVKVTLCMDNLQSAPAIIELGLDSAGNHNVENICTQRMVVVPTPVTRTLRMRSPNQWKEDEQRDQSLFSCSNFNFIPGSSPPISSGTVCIYCQARFQFGSNPWQRKNVAFTLPRIRSLTLERVSRSSSFSNLEDY